MQLVNGSPVLALVSLVISSRSLCVSSIRSKRSEVYHLPHLLLAFPCCQPALDRAHRDTKRLCYLSLCRGVMGHLVRQNLCRQRVRSGRRWSRCWLFALGGLRTRWSPGMYGCVLIRCRVVSNGVMLDDCVSFWGWRLVWSRSVSRVVVAARIGWRVLAFL